MTTMMRAWVVSEPGPVSGSPLAMIQRAVPTPGPGEGASRFSGGDRIGIAWLRHTCGACRWCRGGRENLCPSSRYTGWDADGGYAGFAVVPEAFAYRIPTSTS